MGTSLRSAAIGLVAGGVAGLLGVGGGIIFVPGLVLLVGLDQRRAHATSVAIIVAAATTALLGFAIEGNVDWPAAGYLFAGSAAGAYLGARNLERIPEIWLTRAFVVLLFVAAIRLAIG